MVQNLRKNTKNIWQINKREGKIWNSSPGPMPKRNGKKRVKKLMKILNIDNYLLIYSFL